MMYLLPLLISLTQGGAIRRKKPSSQAFRSFYSFYYSVAVQTSEQELSAYNTGVCHYNYIQVQRILTSKLDQKNQNIVQWGAKL